MFHPAYVGHFKSFVCGGSTMQCFMWLNSYHVCDASGTIAAVTEVHCLFDVSCCLAVDQETLKGSFLWTGMRMLIKFHVLLGKSAWKYYKEGLGIHAPSCETVCQLVIAITNGQKERDDASQNGAPKTGQKFLMGFLKDPSLDPCYFSCT